VTTYLALVDIGACLDLPGVTGIGDVDGHHRREMDLGLELHLVLFNPLHGVLDGRVELEGLVAPLPIGIAEIGLAETSVG